MMLGGGTYIIRCRENGRIYVGSSVNRSARWSQHIWYLKHNKHHSRALQEDWDTFGAGAFVFEPVDHCEDRVSRLALEQALIDEMQPFGPRGYNTAPLANSTRGAKRTAEQIERMASFFRGRPISTAHRQAISAAGLGRKHKPETKEKMRQRALEKNGQRGRPLTETQRAALLRSGEEHPWYGRKHSEQSRKRMSDTKSHPLEQIDSSGAVIARWPSAKDAATAFGLKWPDSILRAANYGRKAAGFSWRKAL